MLLMTGLAGLLVAVAQQPPPQEVVVSAVLGRGSTWDDEGRIGAGVSTGAIVDWRVRPRWSASFRLERLGHERHTSQDLLVFDGRTLFATGEIAYRFGSRAAVPFVTGGYGAALYSGTLTDRIGPTPTRHRTSRSGVAVAGGGVEIPIGDRFIVTPEIRLLMCQPTDDFAPWVAIRAGINAGWRFGRAR
jgi:hypothetical protein